MRITNKQKILAALAVPVLLSGCATMDTNSQSAWGGRALKLEQVADPKAYGAMPGYERSGAVAKGRSDFLRMAFVEKQGRVERRLVATRLIANGRQWLYPKADESWGQGAAAQTLASARLRSDYHRPFKAQAGDKTYWVVHDTVCGPDEEAGQGAARALRRPCVSQAEIYGSEPDFLTPPLKILTLRSYTEELPGPRQFGEIKGAALSSTFPLGEELFDLGLVTENSAGAFSRFELRRWRPDVPALLASEDMTVSGVTGATWLAYEKRINDALIEWKVQDMIPHLRRMSGEATKDLQIQIEKLLFRLEARSRALKDAVDKDAQTLGNDAPEKAAEVAHQLDQRRTVLIAILGTVKEAARSRKGE